MSRTPPVAFRRPRVKKTRWLLVAAVVAACLLPLCLFAALVAWFLSRPIAAIDPANHGLPFLPWH